jgi:hypothetical protein
VALESLACPQCGASLPKQARWRFVTCSYCKANVTLASDLVRAATFREALVRARSDSQSRTDLECKGQRFTILSPLGRCTGGDVFLVLRSGPAQALARLTVATSSTDEALLAREVSVLAALHDVEGSHARVLGRRVPHVLVHGTAKGKFGNDRPVLALRQPAGAWGSLAAAHRSFPKGVDPRHAVWMWRRVLELLSSVHAAGWVHGDLILDHQIVHPEDHGVHLVGWSRATPFASSRASSDHSLHEASPLRDLVQSAWAVRTLLSPYAAPEPIYDGVPQPLVDLLERVTQDLKWTASQSAMQLRQSVGEAAEAAFGPPRFIPFHP